jgi:hypothetical protein
VELGEVFQQQICQNSFLGPYKEIMTRGVPKICSTKFAYILNTHILDENLTWSFVLLRVDF